MPQGDDCATFRFGDFELNLAAYELRCRGKPVRLERHPMDLLKLLVERRNQLVSRSDIVDRLWGEGVFVDVETGVNTAIRKVRQALQDSQESPRFVETVFGKGYRFIAPVTVEKTEAVSQSPVQSQRSGRLNLPEGASLAVLPFANLSDDPSNQYFCAGLAEELINALAKLEQIRVVARTSAFSFKGKEADVRDIGRKLKVSTVLEGSVRKSGNRLRITAQLVNAVNGYHLWSERYDTGKSRQS